MDIAAWLRGLGLEQYDRTFRDYAIDAEILPELTDEHLKELGLPLGHRLKLLKAIAALRTEPRVGGELLPTAAAQAATGEGRSPPAPAASEAERRQLTVMFVDLVGSTALSQRLDPEDMRGVIRAYQNAVAGEVARFEGHVAKFMGDGVLAYFGWPKAQEDAAERAIRAGLAVAGAIRQLDTRADMPLAVRVGIATGLVVVGDLIGEGAAREEAVVGETPNLAARLQVLAEPNGVVIAPGTHRLVGGLFELEDLGARDLKGFAAPMPAWRVLRPSRAEGRFEARHAAGLTPLVGREEEVALLLRRWEQAKEGEGQVVLLQGEPGIGKSRLTRTLRERLSGEAYTPLHYQCSPYHRHSVLYPVIDQLERAAGFDREDTAETKLEKLEALLAQSAANVREVTPLLAALLSIPTGDPYPPLDLTPQRQKELTLRALVAQLPRLAAKQPVLVVLEDAHWVDPTSLELFGLVVDRARDLPVLVVITFRPEFRPPWANHAHVALLTLSRLGRRQAAAMAERVTGGKVLPPEVLDQVVAKTDGVPLFVEELTKTVLESGLLMDVGGRYALTGPLPPLAIPSTLHDSLLARLDRLAPVKEVAQVGAALGREFSHELLVAVAPLPEDRLREALDELVAAELVFRRGTPPEVTYSFKHALVQDAAYDTLLRSRRQQLHARIVQVLEERFPETAEMQPELLAHHCAQAGLAEAAVDYWHRAGQLAVARSAMAEAVAQLRAGLEAVQGLPEGEGRDRRELELQVTLGVALVAARGQGAPETGRAYARARELAERLGETQQLFRVLYGLCSYHCTRAELPAGREAAATLLGLAREQHDVAAQTVGHRSTGSTAVPAGEFAAARAELERALALYDPVEHRRLAFVYGQDPWASATAWLVWALLALGYPDQARARHDEALAEAQQLGHPHTLAQVLFCCCTLHQLLRDRQGIQQEVDALVPLAAEQGFPHWLAMATIFRGWALAEAGEAEAGIALIDRGLADYRATAAELWVPYFLALLADAHARAGQAAQGLSRLAEALARVQVSGARWIEAELHRHRGEVLRQLPEPGEGEAEICFHRALAVARGQNAKLWELRAATSLARLWRDQGRCGEAHDLLAPVYGWFTEGFDTQDLRDARTLLDELGSTPASSAA